MQYYIPINVETILCGSKETRSRMIMMGEWRDIHNRTKSEIRWTVWRAKSEEGESLNIKTLDYVNLLTVFFPCVNNTTCVITEMFLMLLKNIQTNVKCLMRRWDNLTIFAMYRCKTCIKIAFSRSKIRSVGQSNVKYF